MTRIACGSTMRRITWPRDMPSACAASVCPSSIEEMPARTISAMYAASDSASPSRAATNAVRIVLALTPKNRPSRLSPNRFAIWRSNGMPMSYRE